MTTENYVWIGVAVFFFAVFCIGVADDQGAMRKTKTRKVVGGVAEGVATLVNLIIFAGLVVLAFLAFFTKW